MLRYLGTGRRWYGQRPMRVYRRGCWEFQAVVAGRIAPVLDGGAQSLAAASLWVFPPETAHGWTGDGKQAAEVVVLHFAEVPAPLRLALPSGDWLRIDLTADDLAALHRAAGSAAATLRRPDALSPLQHQRLQLELALLALRGLPPEKLPRPAGSAEATVERALAWWGEQLAQSAGSAPSLHDVAQAVFVSPAHLRRLFHQVLHESPRQALERVRFARAMQIMEDGRLKLEAVAEACGYGSASAFSRAFKHWHRVGPREWLRSRRPEHRHG
jgi:AraC family transcriptional regulator